MNVIGLSAFKQLMPALERVINTTIAMDPASAKSLSLLQGCVLEINITSLKQSFFFGVDGGKVHVLDADITPTVTLSGTSLGLTKLALQKDKTILFRRKEVSLAGDAVRAQQIQNFMRALHIDWEGLLAEVIGDVPAHLLATSLQQGLQWSKTLGQNFRLDLEEYLKYELRMLPNKAMALKQFEAIDQLRLATDRLEAKFKHLIKQKSKSSETCQN